MFLALPLLVDGFSRSSQSLWISPQQFCLTSSSPCLSFASGGKNNLVIWPIIYIEIIFCKISLAFKMLRWFIFTTFQEISLCCFRFSVPNCFSCVQLCATLWTAASQAPLPSFRGFLILGSYQWPLCLLHWQVGSLPLAPAGKASCTATIRSPNLFPYFFCRYFNINFIYPNTQT